MMQDQVPVDPGERAKEKELMLKTKMENVANYHERRMEVNQKGKGCDFVKEECDLC